MVGTVTLNHSIDYNCHRFFAGDVITLPLPWYTTMLRLGFIVAGVVAPS